MTRDAIAAFLRSKYGVRRGDVAMDVQSLSGGLESVVARVTLRTGRDDLPGRFIVKRMRGRTSRELAVYRHLGRRLPERATGTVLGTQRYRGVQHLYLEDLSPSLEWPWADLDIAARVCRVLAALHALPAPSRQDWDYESELAASASSTLMAAGSVRDPEGRRLWQRLGDLRRVVDQLGALRRRLAAERQVFIHGDLHPGNVVVRPEPGGPRVALIDWARARHGSPFEDVASWLQSLGCWEPQARRRHDWLLTRYLLASGDGRRLDGEVRTLYWLAGASNGLAGAIRYHLAVLGHRASQPSARYHSDLALRAWQRVVRRAAHVIRAGR